MEITVGGIMRTLVGHALCALVGHSDDPILVFWPIGNDAQGTRVMPVIMLACSRCPRTRRVAVKGVE